jgi:hypothetical protein
MSAPAPWPAEDSVLAVERFDVMLGATMLAVGCALLYALVGLTPVLVVVAVLSVLTLCLGLGALVHGQRGLRVLPGSARLAVGFLGRWFSGW